jgi:hypothetical protein
MEPGLIPYARAYLACLTLELRRAGVPTRNAHKRPGEATSPDISGENR